MSILGAVLLMVIAYYMAKGKELDEENESRLNLFDPALEPDEDDPYL